MSKECLLCGESNIDSAAVCKNCGGKSFTMETSAESQTESAARPVLILTDRKSGKIISISDSCLIGREGDVEADFFARDMYISRNHCRVILEDSVYKIEHIGKNPTKINNVELVKGIHSIIRDGDYLTIADKIFDVSICRDSVLNEAIQETKISVNDDIANKTKYSITCPVCKTKYPVINLSDRINECSYCDEYNKYKISEIEAVEFA